MLKFALKLDGVGSFLAGLLILMVRPENGIPIGWLIGVGIFFVIYGAGVFFLGTRATPDRRAVLMIIIGNLVWGVDSILVAELKWFPLTGAGTFHVLAQAAAVIVFAALQIIGYRAAFATARGTRPRSQSLA